MKVTEASHRKLKAKLKQMAELAACLAARLQDATASEEQSGYDRSRTFVDRQDDHDYAVQSRRIILPTLRALEKEAKQNGTERAT